MQRIPLFIRMLTLTIPLFENLCEHGVEVYQTSQGFVTDRTVVRLLV